MYARLTLLFLLSLAFFNCRGQDTLGVYKEIIPGITSCETINRRENAYFSGIKFENDALFPCNRFINRVDFSFAHFKSLADFHNTQFNSKTYFQSVQFNSRAYFRSVQFSSLADFNNAQFNSRAYFRLAQFDARTDFRSVQFNSLADFYNTQFSAKVYFRLARFDSLADFSSTHFYSMANFSATHFYSMADFRNMRVDVQSDFNLAKFHSRTDFYNSYFYGFANFSSAHFHERTNFRLVQFGAQTDFSFARFDSKVDFQSVHFKDKVDFRNAYFRSNAYFSKASFEGNTNFRGAILPDTLYFNGIKEIHKNEIIDFTFCRLDSFKASCAIDLANTEIDKIKLGYLDFQLIFPDTNYTFEVKCITYEQLLKTQKDYGFMSGYEKLDKEYQEFKYMHHPSNKSSLIAQFVNYATNFFQKHWWDYGYYKAKVLCWSLFFWLIFSIINWLLFDKLNREVYRIDYVFNPYRNRNKSIVDFHQVVPAVIYSALLFFGLKMSAEKINYKNKVGVIYIYFQYVLGLICLAYIANFIILSE